MNNCNPSLINALSLCNFYSPKKAQPLTMFFVRNGWLGIGNNSVSTKNEFFYSRKYIVPRSIPTPTSSNHIL